jgi:predicted metal-dependent hydrolase
MNKPTSIDLERSQPLDKSGGKQSGDGFAPRASATPADHALNVRDERFDRSHQCPRLWHSGDPVATAWYNSVSASLPRGEAFFIDTMRDFRDDVPPKIAREIKAFCTQEINHTREHVAFNRLVADHGYNVESIDQGIQAMLALVEGRPKEFNLAITIALEHFAAIISRHLLSDPRYLEGADPVAADVWRWHATEEVEHKGITYDVWLHATKDWSRWKRYRVKTLIALLITRKYFKNRRRDAYGLMEQDGIPRWKAKWKLAWLLWGNPGMMRRMFFEWADILMPGFHPWNHDDRKLIQKWESPYADAVMPAE